MKKCLVEGFTYHDKCSLDWSVPKAYQNNDDKMSVDEMFFSQMHGHGRHPNLSTYLISGDKLPSSNEKITNLIHESVPERIVFTALIGNKDNCVKDTHRTSH